MATANLGITEVAAAVDDKVTQINEARNHVEDALTDALLSKAVTDGADTVLTTTEGGEALGFMYYQFTGTLTAIRNVEVPDNTKLYAVQCDTVDFGIVVQTNAGAGISLSPGQSKLLYCDGTDVVEISTAHLIPLVLDDIDLTVTTSQFLVSPVAGRIRRVDTVVTVAAGTGAAVVGIEIGGTDVTGSDVTIADSAIVGEVDTSGDIADTTANDVTAGQQIEITSDAGSTTGNARVVVLIEQA